MGPLALDECAACLGVWFDRGELQRLVRAEAAKALPQRFLPQGSATGALPSTAMCPRCLGALAPSAQHAGAALTCGSCRGAWLSAAALAGALGGGATPSEGSADLARPATTAGPASSAAAVAVGAPPVDAAPGPREGAPADEAEHEPGEALHAEGPCPACGGRLQATKHAGQALHACERCGGLHFPRGGLHFFLEHGAATWLFRTGPAVEPIDGARCPGCDAQLHRVRWQDHPVRVWACTGCWTTFASADGARSLASGAPPASTDTLTGPALVLWRLLDAFTEWVVNPPKSDRYSAHRPRRS